MSKPSADAIQVTNMSAEDMDNEVVVCLPEDIRDWVAVSIGSPED